MTHTMQSFFMSVMLLEGLAEVTTLNKQYCLPSSFCLSSARLYECLKKHNVPLRIVHPSMDKNGWLEEECVTPIEACSLSKHFEQY